MRTSTLLASALAAAPAAAAPSAASLDWSIPSLLTGDPLYGAPDNDFSCRSEVHPNPVIMFHGLSANRQVDLNTLSWHLKDLGYCVYSETYGAHRLARWIGGVRDMRESAKEIADFIFKVKKETGADKVDLVGHSEGGVMALYVPMTQEGVAEVVERNIALGPAVHGAEYFGFTDLFYMGGEVTRRIAARALKVLGCHACDDMARGGNVYKDFLEADQIVQEGNKATIIVSDADTLVAPDASMVEEKGVRNVLVQDYCPDDKVGHAGLAWDKTVWGLIKNALTEDYEADFECDEGLPFKN